MTTKTKTKRLGKFEMLAEAARRLIESNYRLENVHLSKGTNNSVALSTEKDWDYYSKRYSYPKIQHYSVFTLNAKALRLLNSDLGIIDGIINIECTLDSKLSTDDVSVYKIKYLKQGAGYKISIASGYLARQKGYGVTHNYHAKTAKAAIRGLARKVKICQEAKGVRALVNEIQQGATPPDLVQKYGVQSVQVTDKEAYKLGFCKTGVRGYRHRLGLGAQTHAIDLATFSQLVMRYPNYSADRLIITLIAKQSSIFRATI